MLDVLAACRVRVSETAERLGLSSAHLVKFIQNDPKLWKQVNQMRLQVGARPLR